MAGQLMQIERPWRRRFLELLLPLVSLLVSLVVADWCFGLLYPERELVGPTRPGSYVFVNREFVQRQRNGPDGFRSSSFAPAPGTRNVLLLGDSYVEGMGLSDEETIAWKLNERGAPAGLQFLNAGRSGASIDDYVRIHDSVIRGLPHEFEAIVLFVYLGNDVLDYDRLSGPGATKTRGKRFLPNIRRWIRRYRDQRERAQWFQTVDAAPYARWLERNREYFGRSAPLDAEERAWMEERFQRIPADLRASMREGLVNPWNFQWMVTPGMQDLVYNVDSEANRRAAEATARRLQRFLDRVEVPVFVVLVPSKLQVSPENRQLARSVLGGDVEEDELGDLLQVNRALRTALRQSMPEERILDLSEDVLSTGWQAWYYPIDDHFHAEGAERAAERVWRLLGPAPGRG
jgi:hypothetical protein